MKGKKSIVMLLIYMVLLCSGLTLFQVSADSKTVEAINPLTGTSQFFFNTTTMHLGSTFMARIRVINVSNLWQFQVLIGFDPALLNAVELTYTSDIDDWVFKAFTNVPVTPQIDNTIGFALGGCNIMGAKTFNGSGTLCMVKFQVMKEPPEGGVVGPSPIDIITSGTNPKKPGFYTYLADLDFNEMSYTDVDGQYRLISPSPPPPTATIYVDPQRIVNFSLTPCHEFSVNVSIKNVAYLAVFEFKLGFEPTIIKAMKVELGDFFPPEAIISKEINNETGYVWFSAALPPSEPPRSGNETLAKVTFHVEGLGQSNLHLYDTILTDDFGQPLPHVTADGYFNNVLLAKLYVEPPKVINATLVPPKTFNINVTLDDVENLYGYEFNMSYNPTILTCISINIQEVLGEPNFDPVFTVNNIKGFIWVKVTYYPPADPITTYSPVTLVILTFRVKGYGATDLDLHDTTLSDNLGNPITHEVEDGFFQNFRRNVATVGITLSHSIVYQGWIVKINVTVKNKGDLTETFDVKAYYDSNLIGVLTAVDLLPGNETTLTFNFSTSGLAPCHNYTISAKAGSVPYEIDLSDNNLTDGSIKVKIMGDADGDGKVDMKDVGAVVDAFGSYPGHPRWNPNADMNGSGFVDMKDVGLTVANFGKTCH